MKNEFLKKPKRGETAFWYSRVWNDWIIFGTQLHEKSYNFAVK